MPTPPAGPLETTVRQLVEPREEVWGAEPGEDVSAENYDRAYKDAAEAREALNAHMGWLQRRKEEVGIRAAQAAAGDKYRFERETDPILRPDGQC